MSRPVLLDLFCGAGGAAEGYHRAGYDVVGVDLAEEPRFPYEFRQGDALELGAELLATGRFAAVHASPPCQAYSSMTKKWGRSSDHPDLVEPTRQLLRASGLPWVIENVIGAPLHDPTMLCGTMFGLRGDDWHLRRHRIFESSEDLSAPGRCDHRPGYAMQVNGHPGGSSKRDPKARFGSFAEWQEAMGDVTWMNAHELRESIPPAYTEWIGRLLLQGAPPAEGQLDLW